MRKIRSSVKLPCSQICAAGELGARLLTSPHPLRPHQAEALTLLRQSIATGHRRPMLQLPTGSGKTVIGAHIATGAVAKGKRVGFIVPVLGLIDQTFGRFVENGIAPEMMGVIQADHSWRRPDAPIQICSAQTLARRGMPLIDVALIDEAHISNAALHAWLRSGDSANVVAVGLSATPWANGLGLVYDDLISPISMQALIDLGHLSPFRVFAPSHPDLRGVKIDAKSGDYAIGGLSAAMSDGTLVADVVSTWIERAEGRPTLCFAVDRAHAAVLAEQFKASGVPAAYVDAFTTRDERQAIMADLRAGTLKVIVNIGTMTTGVDEDVRCIVLARPTRSESLFAQIIGRGLRTADGKDYCLILDHSDSHLRLGMVTDLGRDKLDTGKPRAGDAKQAARSQVKLPTECRECRCLIPFGARQCPSCGAFVSRASEVQGGKLVELSARKAKADLKRKADVFGQLRAIGQRRHYSNGWASWKFREWFGVWPNAVSWAPPVEPKEDVLAWVKAGDEDFTRREGRETYSVTKVPTGVRAHHRRNERRVS